ncbi:HTH-type transcriptional repressor PurR [Arthrobacter sp. Hiyo6]|nr:HTH-type transcriptional repressor PurR [Arthrobacter sp. Hiyo6]
MAVDQITHDAGYTIFIGYSRDNAERQHEIVSSMIERQVDGLLVLPAPDTDPEKLNKQVNAANVPVVLLARRFPGFDYVGSENVKGATMLGEHLAALGCRSVAFVGGRAASSLSEREEGLRTSLEPNGCEVWSTDELRSAITPEGGTAAVGRLFDLGRLPDAIVATTMPSPKASTKNCAAAGSNRAATSPSPPSTTHALPPVRSPRSHQ